MDPMTGRIDYSNPSTGQSSWEIPEVVPQWSSSGFLDTSSSLSLSSGFVDTSVPVPVSPVVGTLSSGASTTSTITTTKSHKEIRKRIRQRLLVELETSRQHGSDKIELALVRLDCVKAVAFHQSSEEEILHKCLKEGNSATKQTAARRRERRRKQQQPNVHYWMYIVEWSPLIIRLQVFQGIWLPTKWANGWINELLFPQVSMMPVA